MQDELSPKESKISGYFMDGLVCMLSFEEIILSAGQIALGFCQNPGKRETHENVQQKAAEGNLSSGVSVARRD